MIPIIGYRTCRLKAYPLSKFEITDEDAMKSSVKYDQLDPWNSGFLFTKKTESNKIEKRVQYFHIAYIPIFPNKTHWTLRKKDGKLYYATENSIKKIKKYIKKDRSPWYMYFGPIFITLTLAIFLLNYFLLNPIMHNYKYSQTISNRLESTYDEKIKMVNNLDENYFISFKVLKEKHIDLYLRDYSTTSYGKVLRSTRDSIHIGVLNSKEKKIKRYDQPYFIYKTFEENKKELKVLKFSKDHFEKFVPNSYEQLKQLSDNSNGLVFDNSFKYSLLNDPDIKIHCTASGFEIINKGKPLKLIEIKNLKEDHEWGIGLPLKLFAARGRNGKYAINHEYAKNSAWEIELTFKDDFNSSYIYILNKNTNCSLEKI
ncbi:hypothetical protein [uncultured Aquimarina sp.]|uniref:hypothetical protein n=1 Tax=uncultured Aquimarina sp. TaxID=575652 RepID=UPI0026044D0A|nr:hypothetical protein [uncultured Aquimarina sp.]